MKAFAKLVVCRIYGQPKIHKPKELRRCKPAFSMTLNASGRKNHIFLLEGDVYVYFFDLFSREHGFPDPEDMALPYPALREKYPDELHKGSRDKFCYADSWPTILDRNEGYVCFPGLVEAIRQADYLPALTGELFRSFCELSHRDSGFCPIREQMDMRSADYYRLLNDLTGTIYRMIKDRKL